MAVWRQAARGAGRRLLTVKLTAPLQVLLTAVSHRGSRTPESEVTSRHKLARRALLRSAARRDAVVACTTRHGLMAERTVAAVFPATMETIQTGYWKISSRPAINGYHRCRFRRVAPGATWDG
jgi:hypothetical protein